MRKGMGEGTEREKHEAAVAARESLTKRQFQCVALRWFEGLDYRGIGMAAGISHVMAWRHVKAGLKKLRKAGIRLPGTPPQAGIPKR